MPSPILHSAAGYSIYLLRRRQTSGSEEDKALLTTLLISVIFSLLPDVDSAVGLIRGNFGRYHNNLTHSLFAGLVVALPFSFLMQRKQRRPFKYWFSLSLLAYFLHVIMDSLTWGRGVMAFWPFTSSRYRIPLRLFYGFHWSEGWRSRRHLWTVLTELFLIGSSALAVYHLLRKKP